jgi:hypothetical protein
MSMDGTSMMFDPRHETRELGCFFFTTRSARRSFAPKSTTCAASRVQQLSGLLGRTHQQRRESELPEVDRRSPAPEVNRLAERATFAIALHDDARVDAMLIEMIRRPVDEPMRSRAIYWLGNTPETAAKNTLFTEIVRNNQESTEARNAAMSALAMSRSAARVAVATEPFRNDDHARPQATRTQRRRSQRQQRRGRDVPDPVAEAEKDMELRKSAIANLGRIAGQKSLGALTSTVDGDADVELQKQAVVAIGRRPKDEAVPILIRTARNHPKMAVRKLAIQVLGQTGDERAVAFFRELLSKD